jgi:hypothetical protein
MGDMARPRTPLIDAETLARLESLSRALGLTPGEVVREAIREYGERRARSPSAANCAERLRYFDEALARIPPRPLAAVEAELREIRHSRRRGGRGAGAR